MIRVEITKLLKIIYPFTFRPRKRESAITLAKSDCVGAANSLEIGRSVSNLLGINLSIICRMVNRFRERDKKISTTLTRNC